MRLIGLFVSFIISINAFAGFVGGGQSEFGFSQDNEDNNFGLSARYDLTGDISQQQININTQMQLGSKKGRSLVATAAHDYQYENSYIYNDVQHVYKFPFSGVRWNSQVSKKLNFENEINDSDSTLKDKMPLLIPCSISFFVLPTPEKITFLGSAPIDRTL